MDQQNESFDSFSVLPWYKQKSIWQAEHRNPGMDGLHVLFPLQTPLIAAMLNQKKTYGFGFGNGNLLNGANLVFGHHRSLLDAVAQTATSVESMPGPL